MKKWNDIEQVLQLGSIEELDKETLLAFLKVEAEPSKNPAYHVRYKQAQERIALALAKIDSDERKEADSQRHREAILLSKKANQLAKIAIIIAIFATLVSILQLF